MTQNLDSDKGNKILDKLFRKTRGQITKQVMEDYGYTLKEFKNKTLQDFHQSKASESATKLRFDHYHKNRLNKLSHIAKEVDRRKRAKKHKLMLTEKLGSSRQARYNSSQDSFNLNQSSQSAIPGQYSPNYDKMQEVFQRRLNSRLSELERKASLIKQKAVRGRPQLNIDEKAQAKKELQQKRRLEILQRKYQVGCNQAEDLRQKRALRLNSIPTPRITSQSSTRSQKRSVSRSVSQFDEDIDERLQSINQRIQNAVSRSQQQKQEIREKMHSRSQSVNRTRQRVNSVDETRQTTKLQMLNTSYHTQRAVQEKRQQSLREAKERLYERNASRSKLGRITKMKAESQKAVEARFQKREMAIQRRLKEMRAAQETAREIRGVQFELKLSTLKENLSKRERLIQRYKKQILDKHQQIQSESMHKTFERQRFLDERNRAYMGLVEHRERLREKEEKLKSKIFGSLLQQLSYKNMASNRSWVDALYIYSQDHAANVNAQIEAIKEQKGEACSFEDFKKFDVFHLGGHVGLERLIEEVGINSELELLDVGSGLGGSGRFLHEKTGVRIHGVDMLQHFLDLCGKMTQLSGKSDKLQYQQGDINTIELQENRYDGAYTIAVYLMYIVGNQGMKNVFKSLKLGGWFYLEDWYGLMTEQEMPQDVAENLYGTLGFVALRTQAQIRSELEDAGFVVEVFEDIGRQNSEAAWDRSQEILKKYKDQGETGDAVFMKSVTDYGIGTAKICPHLDHLSPEQIRERWPESVQYIPDWEDIIFRGTKYASHCRVLARKPQVQQVIRSI